MSIVNYVDCARELIKVRGLQLVLPNMLLFVVRSYYPCFQPQGGEPPLWLSTAAYSVPLHLSFISWMLSPLTATQRHHAVVAGFLFDMARSEMYKEMYSIARKMLCLYQNNVRLHKGHSVCMP